MANIHKIVHYLDALLGAGGYDDYSANGLQVEGSHDVTRMAFGVSASLRLFKEAQRAGAQAVLVHHGLLWKGRGTQRITGVLKNRVGFLLRHGMSLAAYHLPLDGHEKAGNNILIAKKFGLVRISRFASHGNQRIGIIGYLKKPSAFADMKKKALQVFGQVAASYPFGPRQIRKVAVVSGGAASDFQEAICHGADLYITGENAEPNQELARESQRNFIAAGHYATEKFGAMELERIVRRVFGIKTFFIDIPNRA